MAARRRLIDIGANLTDPMFRGIYNGSQKHVDDLQEVLKRAAANGLDKVLVTGGSLEDSRQALNLARTHGEWQLLPFCLLHSCFHILRGTCTARD
ncbi:unnamed protein product [Ixodes pacificus]